MHFELSARARPFTSALVAAAVPKGIIRLLSEGRRVTAANL